MTTRTGLTGFEKQLHTDQSRQSSTIKIATESDKAVPDNSDPITTAEDEFPHGARFVAIVVSLLLGMFLVSLDNVSYMIWLIMQ